MAVQQSDVKHIDQYLTNFARRYKEGQDVGEFIAPSFTVNRPSDKYLIYGKENHRIFDNKIGRRKRIEEVDEYADESTYSTEEYGLGTFVYDRDLSNVEKPIRLKQQKIENVKKAQMRAREYRILSIATSTALVTQFMNAAADWAVPGTGTPVTDIVGGMISVENGSGEIPNSITMNFEVAMRMILTSEWKDYFKYTESGIGKGLFSAISGLKFLGLEAKISNMRGLNTYEGCASDPTWETLINDTVIVFYRESQPTLESNCFMYSPNRVKDLVRSFYKDEERGWKYTIEEDIDELLVNAECAYLITNCV